MPEPTVSFRHFGLATALLNIQDAMQKTQDERDPGNVFQADWVWSQPSVLTVSG